MCRSVRQTGVSRQFGVNLLAFLPLLLCPVCSSAQTEAESAANPREMRAELEEIRGKIEKGSLRLSKLNTERGNISKDLTKVEKEREAALKQQKELQKSIARLGEEAEQIKLLVFGARLQMGQQRARMNRRLVAMYKAQRRAPNVDYLFQAESATDLLKRARYLAEIAEHDRLYVNRLIKLVEKGQADRERLENLLQARRIGLTRLKETGERLEKQRLRKAKLLREREAKAKQQEATLRQLQASADKLEKILASVMGEEPVTVVSVVPKTGPEQTTPPEFQGRGLQRLKGKLLFPVSGSLVQRFGKQRHQEFEDILFKKGLEVSARPGAKVKAVAPGRVVFTQELPGYGKVVILDHGKRYYTLYGRIGSSDAEMGQLVGAGEVIAELGEIDSKGRNFYFELRIRGKASNPTPYFSNPPQGT